MTDVRKNQIEYAKTTSPIMDVRKIVLPLKLVSSRNLKKAAVHQLVLSPALIILIANA
jgi:hypothetical protein